MKFGISVVVLSQINRQGDEKPTLANLKGTGSIEEIADAVIILHQKSQKENFVERDSNRVELIMDVAKNRFGPVGYFESTFEAHTGRFLNQIFLKDVDSGKDWTDK
jgi:replicative DNA helicase